MAKKLCVIRQQVFVISSEATILWAASLKLQLRLSSMPSLQTPESGKKGVKLSFKSSQYVYENIISTGYHSNTHNIMCVCVCYLDVPYAHSSVHAGGAELGALVSSSFQH